MKRDVIHLIGYASGIAANNIDCALGPWYLYYHPNLFEDINLSVSWANIIQASSLHRGMTVLPLVKEKTIELGKAVMPFAKARQRFCVFGGDHASAMGTWSALAHAHRQEGDVGLLWIDAHMDSHTPNTSESQNIHGMPLAHLLGFGEQGLTNLFDNLPALKPENICLVGVRSYESGEHAFLLEHGVRIIMMEEVQKMGIDAALQEAYNHVSRNTIGVGISLDLDGIDPLDAPGVGCREPNGISGRELVEAFKKIPSIQSILGLEIVEYNPIRDENNQTARLAVELLHAIYG